MKLQAAKILGVHPSCDFPQIETLVLLATPEQLAAYKDAIIATPHKFQNWLLDVLLREKKDGDRRSAVAENISREGFARAVLKIVAGALNADGKAERRGFLWSDTIHFSLLKESKYADFQELAADIINQDSEYLRSIQKLPNSDALIAYERSVAVHHVPALVAQQDGLVDLLSAALNYPDATTKSWAAVNLSLAMPTHKSVPEALLNSFFSHSWLEFRGRGEAISTLALLTLASRNQPEKSLLQQRAALEQCRKFAISTEPADRRAAEEAAQKLYIAFGLKPPTLVWADSPVRKESSSTNKSTTQSSDSQRRYFDSIVHPYRLFEAVQSALHWYTNGSWAVQYESEYARLWPPSWTGARATGWLLPEWFDWMSQLLSLEGRADSTKPDNGRRYWREPIRLAQFDSIWIGLISFSAQLIGVEDQRLHALMELCGSCGGALLLSDRCIFYERPSRLIDYAFFKP